MTKSDHEKERRAFWDESFHEFEGRGESPERIAVHAVAFADAALAERDKRFPAPKETSDAR